MLKRFFYDPHFQIIKRTQMSMKNFVLIICMLFCIEANAQRFTIGLDAYNWTQMPDLDGGIGISTGNIILNPTLGYSVYFFSLSGESYLLLGAEINYAITALDIGSYITRGSLNIPISVNYRNQNLDMFFWQVKLGFQYNWMDLYRTNYNFSRKQFHFGVLFAELGTGLARDRGQSFNLGPFIRYGLGKNNSHFFSLGLKYELDTY